MADAGPEIVDSGPMICGTGDGPLPADVVTLANHDGVGTASLATQTWQVTANGGPYIIAQNPAWEQARFELDRPTRVYGFRVQWTDLADAPSDTELEAGLFPDFGHNGFDMWRFDPYWTGTRCVGDLDADGWVTYVLDEPVDIAQPGLVYVGHLRAGEGAPGFLFDGSTDDPDGACDNFDHCRSSINMPEAEASMFYNGITIQVPYDYMVELLIEHTADLPAETLFTELAEPTLSNRVSFGDFDNDGWDDFITTGPRLYRNAGDGTFADVTDASGIATLGANGNGVWGDYDNDGCLDLFVFSETHTNEDKLLHSECDGTFTDATASAGIVDSQSQDDCGDPANTRSPSPAAAWVDIDSDGLLDLYVANFICWSSGGTYQDTIFYNRGDGTFLERTARNGFTPARTASRTVAPIDHDGDGDVDIHVGRYRLERNMFFDNDGDGTVTETALDNGLAGFEMRRAYGHTIGLAWGDLDNDGDFDLVEANLAHPRFFTFSDKTRILLQTPTHTFEDNAGDWAFPAGANGLRYQETHSVPTLADFDQDGDLDLVITCVYDGRPTDFYWGDGDGTFTLDVLNAGITVENGWGAVVSDWDHDGDLDLALRTLFRNDVPSPGHWLQTRVVGNVSANRAAIGATVALTAGGVTRLRYVQGGTAQGGQDSMYLHFGLGDAVSVDSITVTFPGGAETTFTGPFDADQRLWLMEDGTVHMGWAPPP